MFSAAANFNRYYSSQRNVDNKIAERFIGVVVCIDKICYCLTNVGADFCII